MSRKVRPHGTYVKYVVELCRCDECQLASRSHGRQLRRENAERSWGVRPPIFIDAADTREHIMLLRSAGMGQLQIEKLSGVGHTAQWKIVTGRVRRVHRETERAIMGVATDDHVFLRSMVDATEAKAIVAKLLAMGCVKARIAKALGSKAKTPTLQVARAERCTLRTLQGLRLLRVAAERLP